MIEYRGHLDPPLANAPAGFSEEVRRLVDFGGPAVLATAVCDRNQHALVVVVDSSFGPVAVWVRAAKATIGGRLVTLGGEWAATIAPPAYPYCHARCRCSKARIDVGKLLLLAAQSPKRRVPASLLRL